MRRLLLLAVLLALPLTGRAAPLQPQIDAVIRPLMQANAIPGMSVGILIDGQSHIFNYGLASLKNRQPVTGATLFELGSISKTFAATLAAYAQTIGALSLNAPASRYLPELQHSAFDRITLVDLGTHTAGGLTLSPPPSVETHAQLLHYYQTWRPSYPPGATRLYDNTGIALLGFTAAAALHADYSTLLDGTLFPAFSLTHSFIRLPPEEIADYAQGYTRDGKPIRLRLGPEGPPSYGVRATAADLLRFLAINMGDTQISPDWQRAAIATHTGYFRLPHSAMVQDLAWEQYALPVTLAQLQQGNGPQTAQGPHPATALNPPLPPSENTLINKTGSTNGFASYAVFIPAQHVALVLLANRNFPVPARIAAAYAILSQLHVAGLVTQTASPQPRGQ